MIYELKKVKIPEMDISFYMLNLLESNIFPCDGYVRVFPTKKNHFFCKGLNVRESWIRQSWLEFHSKDNQTKNRSWLPFALRNISIGVALSMLPEKAFEICSSEWDYNEYEFLNNKEKQYVLDVIEDIGLNDELVTELKESLERKKALFNNE